MKAKSVIKGALIGITGALALNRVYIMGQIKGMREARKILEGCLEKAKCEKENKHD